MQEKPHESLFLKRFLTFSLLVRPSKNANTNAKTMRMSSTFTPHVVTHL